MTFDDSTIVPFGQISGDKTPGGHVGDATVDKILDIAGDCLETALVIGQDADGLVRVMTSKADLASLSFYLELARQTFVNELTPQPVF